MKSSNNQALLAGLTPAEKFLFSGISLLIVSLAFQFLGAALAAWIYGYEVAEILNLSAYDDPKYVSAFKFMQIVGSIGTFVIPAFIFSFFFAGTVTAYYSFKRMHDLLSVFLVILMMLSVVPFINYLAELNQNIPIPFERLDALFRSLETEAESIMKAFTSTRTLSGLLVNLLMIGIIASIGEELIFRGLLQRILMEWMRNAHIAILVTAIIFSAFHFQFLSFLPRLALGMILGYLMYVGGSIWYPILAHFVNNILGVIYYFFYTRGSTEDLWEEIGTSRFFPLSAIISFVLFLVFFLIWYYRVQHEKKMVMPFYSEEA
ncbi:MAG: CPBP family intramembrane metalloprotease [Bacteroidales bacterium]|nr:CPBP family intramembrane metalloprotease [Bacteroidales bacterium]MBN2698006.1 CPBP family intramembrane metalloprotease [Bacteroidales bacterium]